MDPLAAPVSLAQLLDAQGVEDMLGSFYALFRIPVRIIDEDGATVARSRKPSPLNEYLGQLPGARRRLGDVHQHLWSHDPGESGEFSYVAFTGGSYHVAMVGHEGRRVGRFILGPFITPLVRDAPATLNEADSQLDPARARDLLLALPRVREDTVKAIARHLAVTLDVLIYSGHRALLSEYMHLSTVQENQRQLAARDDGLHAAERRLVEASRLQAEFLSTALGQLRAPLEGILGQSDALASAAVGAAGQRELALALRQRVVELLGLSTRLLDYSRADHCSLTLRCESIDVRSMIERVAAELAALAPERARRLEVHCDPDLPGLWGDAACLEQALTLIGQNSRLRGSDGPIALAVRRASDAGAGDSDGLVLLGGAPERLEIRVSDAGSAIPASEQERVFEPFYPVARVGDGTGAASADGLGLATARRLISAHGGNVRVEDNSPRGATLVVTLPVSGPPAP